MRELPDDIRAALERYGDSMLDYGHAPSKVRSAVASDDRTALEAVIKK